MLLVLLQTIDISNSLKVSEFSVFYLNAKLKGRYNTLGVTGNVIPWLFDPIAKSNECLVLFCLQFM